MGSIWHGERMDGFREVRRRLPIRKESLTQLGRGALQASATVVDGPDGTVYFAHVGTRSASLADLDPDYTGFVIPLDWRGTFVINGEPAERSTIYAPVDGTVFQAFGDARSTVAVALSRADFIGSVAALRGVDTGDVVLAAGGMRLARPVLHRARISLEAMLQDFTGAGWGEGAPAHAIETLTRQVATLVTDIFLAAQRPAATRIRTSTRLGRIIRKAEARFEAAGGGPISLADLCAAAGVSQGTLHHAFMVMCDSSPMAYFKKRRLTDARLALLGTNAGRGSIKSAALGAGLTHLGRFSTEYRQLFGETPTATLNRHP